MALLIFGAIGLVNQQNQKATIERALEAALEQSGPHGLPGLGFRDGQDRSGAQGGRTPVYCVTAYTDGSIYINETSTASMDDDIAKAAVASVLESSASSGVLDEYGLFYSVKQTLTGSRIAFADKTSYLEGVLGFYLHLLGLWAVLMVLVFLITLFLARLVTRPVQQAWDTQQQFIADASHELKTPLTVIMADASILAQDPEKTVGQQRQWVDSIAAEAERMQQLTEGMLTLAQADSNADMSQVMSTLDFSELVEMSLLQFEAVAFERGLTLEDSVEPGLRVTGDAIRLEGLLKTLLENACKYSPKPGTITVTLQRARNMARLSVHNAGEPIPADDLPHLFDRFYRSDKSRVREGETASFGLGLSIAKSTVELHGGRIGVTSDASGTTFTADIPLVK